MQWIRGQFTVFFDDPFWVGVYEREWQGRLQVCKVTFGPEPSDREIQQYLLGHWQTFRFSKEMAASSHSKRRINPKRRQREAARQLAQQGVSTKAQQAIAAQREAGKTARKQAKRSRREEEQKRHFALKQEKKKRKHKGH